MLILKGAGEANLLKAKFNVYHSKEVIEMYLGILDKKEVIIVKNVRAKMKMVYNKQEVKAGAKSNVMIRYTENTLEEIPNSPFKFNKKAKGF